MVSWFIETLAMSLIISMRINHVFTEEMDFLIHHHTHFDNQCVHFFLILFYHHPSLFQPDRSCFLPGGRILLFIITTQYSNQNAHCFSLNPHDSEPGRPVSIS